MGVKINDIVLSVEMELNRWHTMYIISLLKNTMATRSHPDLS
jgi:hypothetical protein